MIDEQLLGAWDTHNSMFWMLFNAIPPEAFAGKPTGMSGRSIGNIFAHVNNIRVGWLEVSAPDLRESVTHIPVKTKAEREAITKDQLRPALEQSAVAVRQMFEAALPKGKLKGQRTPLATMYSYMIAHEWYHIGEIGMTLTLSGNKLDDETAWGIWAWDRWTPGGAGENDATLSRKEKKKDGAE